jgi:hypothetical protein
MCLPTGDLYLQSNSIDPKNIPKNLFILAGMSPVYLGVAYLFLRSMKKKS